MSTRVERSLWLPDLSSWAMLTCVVVVGLALNWFVAAGAVALFLVYRARPFDFIASFLLCTCGATFIYHAGGTLTRDYALLSVGVLLMLFCYLILKREDSFQLPVADLTVPLMAYVLLSFANFARGIVIGHHALKESTLELLPVLALATAPLVGNAFVAARDLRFSVGTLVVLSYASASLGYHIFAIVHRRVSGIFFHPVPGLVAVLIINLALRARKPSTCMLWIALALPLYLHQFLSFRRGLWTGGLVALAVSIAIFVWGSRDSSGSRLRLNRVGMVLGTMLGGVVVGMLTLATLYGNADILEQAGSRFLSIGSTQYQKDEPINQGTMANVERILEYTNVIRHIRESPLIGHGLGYTFSVRSFLHSRVEPQWWVHENYLLVWLKQGIIGLVLFLWMLATAFWVGAKNGRHEDPWIGAWFGTTAACTAFLAVLGISDFPFDLAGEGLFLLALLWGGSMAMTRRGTWTLRWNATPGEHHLR